MNTTLTLHQLHPSFLSPPCSGEPLATLGRPHVIGWENYDQTELTMEPTPKTNELYCDPYGSKYIRGSEELQADTPSLSRESVHNEPRRVFNYPLQKIP